MSFALWFKNMVKLVITKLQKIFPEPLVNRCVNFLFERYKVFKRFLYCLKYVYYSMLGNKNKKDMVKKVYKIMPYTLVGISGLEATFRLSTLMNEKNIEGNFVELGVARGGCSALMGSVAFEKNSHPDRELWLFDSFEGLPDPTEDDFGQDGNCQTGDHVRSLTKGSCLGTIDEVQNLMLNKFHFPKNKVFFVKGWFRNTLPEIGDDVGKIAILRIDGDWYESTKYCLEYMYEQVVQGGAVVIDDYLTCFGCKKAVDEFTANRHIKVDLEFDGRGGCYFIKQ